MNPRGITVKGCDASHHVWRRVPALPRGLAVMALAGSVSWGLRGAAAASLTEIYLPQFAVSGANSASRLQSAAYLRIDGLTPNTSYRYFTGVDTVNTDSTATPGNYFGITPGGSDGLIDGYSSSKALGGALLGNNEFASSGRYSVLTTNATGSYTGWFSVVPTTTFSPGSNIYFYVQLNAGGAGTTLNTTLASTDTLSVLGTGSVNSGSALVGDAGTAIGSEKMVLLYNNVAGTGRPLWVTWTENDAITTNFTSWYEGNVGSTVGRWGAYVPNNLAGGVERVEYRDATGALLGAATNVNGIWGTINTGALTNGSATPPVISAAPAGRTITWNNAAATSTWNTTDANFTDGVSNVAFSNSNADSTVFSDTGVGAVTIAGTVTPALATFNHTAGTFTLAGGSIGGSASVLKMNGGTLVFAASNTYTGGTAVAGGTLVATTQGALPDGGTLAQSNGSTVQLTSRANSGDTRKTLKLATYTSDGSVTILDLNDNDLLIASASGSAVRTFIANGLTGATAPRIMSTWAGAHVGQGLGYMTTDDYRAAQSGSFDGTTLANGGVVVKYTYLGDANLDGLITISDYAFIDAGFLLGKPALWLAGDFNYDGVIDYQDYALIDAAYALNGTALATESPAEMIAAHQAEFGTPYIQALAAAEGIAIPEPGTAVMFMAAFVPWFSRRRKTIRSFR